MPELRQDTECILIAKKQTVKSKKSAYCFTKRCIDLFFSLLAMPIYLILYTLVAVVVKFTDGGPVLYKSVRIGKDGKPFYMYKFRTMKVNADKLEDFLTPEELEKYKKEYKLENDPRVTGIGSILRKTSADELPQILNVIKYDMSLIGPRPVLDEETLLYGKDRNTLLSVKPGLTGYWQAYARNDVGYTDGRRQEMELYYIENRSLRFDTKIFFATVRRVLSGKGVF